ncbi:ribonuclease E inhibitor RraB [Amnibacterium sp. CER49]|uniref:ribonuclease E inhibitor RraB n=1 Tax=Amnibacterium sp. CER49 TaxID=3039161 RepID=UPI002448BFC7|nr:ribonuclease E inhibitor RraB [Amnibacterium sp. CER49]MDH2444250.1 ribonuclease E inhibitor RraB [Amnibacterium sp. CER49]
MTAIQSTLPPVAADVPAAVVEENVAELDEMNSDSWSSLESSGIDAETELELEFAFSAPNEAAARELAEYLENADYDVEVGEPGGELDEWAVTGTTPDVTADEDGLVEWVRRMVAIGWEHGECRLDGWSAAVV